MAICTEVKGAHIVGGEVNYKLIEFNTDSTVVRYRVNFTLYRDKNSGGAFFDLGDLAVFGIYRKNATGEWNYYDEIRGVDPGPILDIELPDIPCFEEDELLALEKGIYSFIVSLPVDDGIYLINYSRCCRSPLITNLEDPDENGFTWNVIISTEAAKIKNSSPEFSESIPVLACLGEEITFDQSATDTDGDILIYSLCAPLIAGGDADATAGGTGMDGCCDCVRPDPNRCPPSFDEVTYSDTHNSLSPLGENSSITMDNSTGMLTLNSAVTGSFAVGICIEEYRAGILIGSYVRDITLTVFSCEPLPTTNYYLDSDFDSYGNPDSVIVDCQSSEGYVLLSGDCDDTNGFINPGEEDIPNNGIDEDCDGLDAISSTENTEEDNFQFYPNPANDRINIISNENENTLLIEIYSITGQLMCQTRGASVIDISSFQKGVYLIHWKDKNDHKVQKLIKS